MIQSVISMPRVGDTPANSTVSSSHLRMTVRDEDCQKSQRFTTPGTKVAFTSQNLFSSFVQPSINFSTKPTLSTRDSLNVLLNTGHKKDQPDGN